MRICLYEAFFNPAKEGHAFVKAESPRPPNIPEPPGVDGTACVAATSTSGGGIAMGAFGPAAFEVGGPLLGSLGMARTLGSATNVDYPG